MKKFETLKAGLGNGLIYSYNHSGGKQKIDFLIGLAEEKHSVKERCVLGIKSNKKLDQVFPHLFPLDHLTKPIRVEGYNDGKEFVPAEELFKGMDNLQLTTFEHEVFNLWATYTIVDEVFTEPIIGVGGIKDADYWIVKKLQSWHFNTEGLDPSDYIDASKSKVYEPKYRL